MFLEPPSVLGFLFSASLFQLLLQPECMGAVDGVTVVGRRVRSQKHWLLPYVTSCLLTKGRSTCANLYHLSRPPHELVWESRGGKSGSPGSRSFIQDFLHWTCCSDLKLNAGFLPGSASQRAQALHSQQGRQATLCPCRTAAPCKVAGLREFRGKGASHTARNCSLLYSEC